MIRVASPFLSSEENITIAIVAHQEASAADTVLDVMAGLDNTPMWKSLVGELERSENVVISDDYHLRLLAARMYLAGQISGATHAKGSAKSLGALLTTGGVN